VTLKNMTLKKCFVLIACFAAGIMALPLTGLAKTAGPVTLVYTGDIDGKINPVPQ
jgi:hypothetical protein